MFHPDPKTGAAQAALALSIAEMEAVFNVVNATVSTVMEANLAQRQGREMIAVFDAQRRFLIEQQESIRRRVP